MDDTRVIIGFDFGMKRIGVAVGQMITKTARPLCTVQAKNGIPQWPDIKKILSEWQPDLLLIGRPVKMDNSELYVTKPAEQFAQELKQQFNLPYELVDERLTTKAAREMVFEQGGYKALQNTDIDPIAAQLIIEHWMGGV